MKPVFRLQVVLLIASAALATTLSPSAKADATYTYTGNPFTDFTGIYPLSGTSNVSGSFSVGQPLASNLFDALVMPTTWNFTDGHFIWVPGPYLDANGDGKPNGLVGTGAFEVTTDSSGNITNWGLSLDISGPATLVTGPNQTQTGILSFLLITNNGEDFSKETFNVNGTNLFSNEADNAGTPGTWTTTTTGSTGGGGSTSMPEPSSLLLLGCGLLSLGPFFRRKRLAERSLP